MSTEHFLQLATEAALKGIEAGCGPFGAVIVKDGQVVATATNQVTKNNDPTAHAEVMAIRQACTKLDTFNLEGCQMYTSCWPCPMCAASCMWSHIGAVYSAQLPSHAEKAGFDDDRFWKALVDVGSKSADSGVLGGKGGMPSFKYVDVKGSDRPFQTWINKEDKVKY